MALHAEGWSFQTLLPGSAVPIWTASAKSPKPTFGGCLERGKHLVPGKNTDEVGSSTIEHPRAPDATRISTYLLSTHIRTSHRLLQEAVFRSRASQTPPRRAAADAAGPRGAPGRPGGGTTPAANCPRCSGCTSPALQTLPGGGAARAPEGAAPQAKSYRTTVRDRCPLQGPSTNHIVRLDVVPARGPAPGTAPARRARPLVATVRLRLRQTNAHHLPRRQRRVVLQRREVLVLDAHHRGAPRERHRQPLARPHEPGAPQLVARVHAPGVVDDGLVRRGHRRQHLACAGGRLPLRLRGWGVPSAP